MRIAIASGIYPPEVGGPALYAEGVKKALEAEGHETKLVLFSDLRRYPTGIRHALYTLALFRAARGVSAIIAFDTYSVGVPAAFVGFLLRVPVILRVGGDFIWETHVERTRRLVTLPDFYKNVRAMSAKERIEMWFVRWMLHHSVLAFNTRWLFDIWKDAYGLSEKDCNIVENTIGEKFEPRAPEKVLALYGRKMVLKNSEAFRRAFDVAQKGGVRLSLEEGLVPHTELLERIRSVYAVALPSVSDVAPNVIIDAMRCGKPFILTKYSGYAERFGEYGIIVDPLSEKDMTRGIKELADSATYERLVKRIAAFREVRSYADVAREYIALINVFSPPR